MKAGKKIGALLLILALLLGFTVLQTAAAETAETYTAEFVTMKAPGTVRISDETGAVDGFVGMKFTVGANPVEVTSLGRIFIEGNTQEHKVVLVDAQTFETLAEVTVPAGGTAGQFTYADLTAHITLAAGKSYYLGSHESRGGDGWYHNDCQLTFTGIAKCDAPAYFLDGTDINELPGWGLDSGAGTAYGPCSFRYVTDEAPVVSEVASEPESSTAVESEPDVPKEQTDRTENLPFLKSILAGTPRNDYEGFVGMQITVGAEPITVVSLGRIFLDGNTRQHEVKIVDAATGEDVPGGSVFVIGGTANEVTYQKLEAPVVLKANKTYYIVTEESADGDTWYHIDSELETASVAKIDSGIFLYEGVWNQEGIENEGFGPTSFLYVADKAEEPVSSEAESTNENAAGVPIYVWVILAAVVAAGVVVLIVLLKKKSSK